MAISKLILNGEVQMDVTSDTVTAGSMLSGTTATKNDGTKATGTIASKSSTDMTVSGATVTAPAGYYANAASKAVATTTHPNPSASITSSTGVVTASHTQGTGYVTGGTTTGTLNLTTQAGKTVTPTETAQTAVASYRWTTGPVSVAAISSTYVGTGVTTRSAADMTVAGQSVTAPAGYYSQAFTKAVTTTTHPNPTATIASSTGVVTATHTQTTGYVTSGTTTGTLNLTTQAAQTINTSTADQTIASNRWLTGVQTIKSVTTTNLTAANIAEGVVVKVGDANNASRITQITGTHSGATSYTATISGSGNSSYCYVTYGGTKRYTNGNTFTFKAGDTLTIYCRGNNASVNGDKLTLSSYSYTYTLPIGDITINLSYSSSTSNSIAIYGLIKPTGDLSITASGTHNTYKYSTATVAAGSAFPPAVTITKAPTIGVNTSGVVTASYNGSSSITPTVTSGYVSQGTAGTISTTGTSTYQLTSKAATTYYPSTADQTIASQRWLVGNQTIKSVTTSNLTAENIAEGVVVKVGDSANASRITQVTGTHSGETTYTATFLYTHTGDSDIYFTYNGIKSTELGSSFTFHAGDTIVFTCASSYYPYIQENNKTIAQTAPYTYTLPAYDIGIEVFGQGTPSGAIFAYLRITLSQMDITENGQYNVCDYGYANVNVPIGPRYTVTITQAGMANQQYITYKDVKYYSLGDTISVPENEAIKIYLYYGDDTYVYVNGTRITGGYGSLVGYEYTITSNIEISFDTTGGQSYIYIRELGGSNITIDDVATHNISGIIKGTASQIKTCAFGYCSNITEIDFPNVTVINTEAFVACYKLSSINLPKLTSAYRSAFAYCSSLTTINLPLLKTISDNLFCWCENLTTVNCASASRIWSQAFYVCSKLTTISFPNVNYIADGAFSACRGLVSIDFPKVTSVASNAFFGCFSLTTANFPLAQSFYSSVFYQCRSLINISCPSLKTTGMYTFGFCEALSTISLPAISSIDRYAFCCCYNLLSLYLLGSSIPTLGDYYSPFSSTPISNYTTSTSGVYGKIYVPASLYSSYLTAPNWSYYSSRFVSV